MVEQLKSIYATWDKRIRDIGLFLIGSAGIINELFFRDDVRGSVLVFCSGMVGLPFVLGGDVIRRNKAQEPVTP